MMASIIPFLALSALLSTPGTAQSISVPIPTPTTTALPIPTAPTGWTYYGCVNELPEIGRTLNGPSVSGNMTIQKCLDFCSAPGQDLPFAGLEYADQCFCGSNPANNGATAGQSGCDMPCSDNAEEICGGPNRLSVYGQAAWSPPGIVASVEVTDPAGTYASQGCFTEGSESRALVGYSFVSSVMTPKVCVDECNARGFSYAGVEYSTECYCGNVLAPGSVAAPPQDCSMKCGGNAKQHCGGPSRLVVYLRAASP